MTTTTRRKTKLASNRGKGYSVEKIIRASGVRYRAPAFPLERWNICPDRPFR